MKRIPQIIDHPDALGPLSVLPGKRQPGSGRIEISSKDIDAATQKIWGARLNKNYFACGCAEASVGLLFGIVLTGAVFATGLSAGWPGIGVLGFPVVGLIGGKIVGLMRAEARLKETIGEIREAWGKVVQTEPDKWICG